MQFAHSLRTLTEGSELHKVVEQVYSYVTEEPKRTLLYIGSAALTVYLVKKLIHRRRARPTDNWRTHYDFIIGMCACS